MNALWHSLDSLGMPGAAAFVLAVLFYAIAGLVPVCGGLYLVYFLLSLPMRRNERTRLFLDCLELGLKDGRSPEVALLEAASSRDQALGVRFHLLAAQLQKGARLGAALSQVPRLVPPAVVAMLKAGERIGDVGRVLPACRRLVNDGVSQVRGALNYLIVLAFAVTPFTVFVPVMLNVVVLPKFREVFAGIGEGIQLPAFTRMVFSQSLGVSVVQSVIVALVWFAALAYLGGPRFSEWLRRLLPGAPDRVQFELPWRRKRLQRDFSGMLAALLEAEIPESEAVRLAGDSTANAVMRRRAEEVCASLQRGIALPEAIGAMDDSGELGWRLANALRRGRGFVGALAGWHDALEAKAFQLEQAAAQIATSALVLFNGVIVAAVVIAVFLPLINLVNMAALW